MNFRNPFEKRFEMNAYGLAYGPTDMKIDRVLSSFQFENLKPIH